MAAYKTIVLELLTEQHPGLHEQLRVSKLLLQAVTDYATVLRTTHLKWIAELTQANPGLGPAQLSSEAMELAMEELQAALPCVSPANEAEARSLDEAMSFLRRHTPPA